MLYYYKHCYMINIKVVKRVAPKSSHHMKKFFFIV